MPSVYVKKYPEGRRTTCLCEQCGREFSVPNRAIARGQGKFCSRECKHESQLRRVPFVCEVCGKHFELRPSELGEGGGRFCSWACRVVGIRGPGNHNWRNDPDHRGWDWKTRRLAALERDSFKCTKCGATEPLAVHHVVPWPETHDNELENLLTLCISCHMTIHKGS